MRWVARLEDVSPVGFVDRQMLGPFASWRHRHSFVAVDESTTEVMDEVRSRLKPHILWGAVGVAMWLGLPLLFGYRSRKTRRQLEGTGRRPI